MAPLFTVRAYGIHTAKVLAQDYLTLGPMYPWTYPAVIISVPECIIGMDKLSRSQDLHIDSLTHGIRTDRKAEKKPPSRSPHPSQFLKPMSTTPWVEWQRSGPSPKT